MASPALANGNGATPSATSGSKGGAALTLTLGGPDADSPPERRDTKRTQKGDIQDNSGRPEGRRGALATVGGFRGSVSDKVSALDIPHPSSQPRRKVGSSWACITPRKEMS